MIWLWRICSRPSFLAALLLGVLPASAGTVSGRVELRDSQDSAVRKKDYSGVVVWLQPAANSGLPLPKPVSGRALMEQRNKTFTPHILPIRVGTAVDFPNFDPIFHNAFSNYNGQLFDVGLYRPGTTRSVRFSRPGVVRVFCNIHANMSAVIVVLETPYFGTTQRDGTFEIAAVPPGEYMLHVFHERATQATLNELARRVTVDAGVSTLAPIPVSEAGYIAIPHQNKYGRDYSAPPADEGLYPGPRK
jgi:plastocyanin